MRKYAERTRFLSLLICAALVVFSADGCFAESVVCVEEVCEVTEEDDGSGLDGAGGSGAVDGASADGSGAVDGASAGSLGASDGVSAGGSGAVDRVSADGMDGGTADGVTAEVDGDVADDVIDGAAGGAEAADSAESLIPAERIEDSDIRALLGRGIDGDIDPEVDAVAEIYSRDSADDGILQMAAENSGQTAEALADAVETIAGAVETVREEARVEMEEELVGSATRGADDADACSAVGGTEKVAADEAGQTAVSEAVRASVEHVLEAAVTRDKQHAVPLDYEPSLQGEEAMACLSSFVLSKVRDGSGDFDETTDLLGNDSSGENNVIRTNDDITYVFSYSTALGERYLYNTIRGARLYLEYRVPFSSDEVTFNTAAMPWLLGDGEGGVPIIIEEDNAQTLIGYRVLPERRGDGGSFCIPGAGTVNCVLRVKNLRSGTEIRPEFCAWLDDGRRVNSREGQNGGEGWAERVLMADTTRVNPVCRVSVGPFLYLSIERSSKVTQVGHGVFGDKELLALADGAPKKLEGSSRVFYYAVRCGKRNGSIKGVDSIDPQKRIHVSFAAAFGANSGVPTDLALYDLRTFSMQTDDGFVRGVFRTEETRTPIEGGGTLRYGTISKKSVKVENSRISFDITDYENGSPGGLISQGTLSFVQREDAADAKKKPIYWASLESDGLFATPVFAGEDAEREFETGSVHRIENQVDPSGNWDSHLLLTTTKGSQYFLTSSSMATDATIGYGMNFNAYISTSFFPKSEASFEKSRDYFLLWDNRKVELRSEGASTITSSLNNSAVFRYITKADGSFWRDGDELRAADFTSASVYQTLRFWPDYDSAAAFLEGVHKGEAKENLNRYICGVVCEAHAAPAQRVGTQYFQRLGLAMKVSADPVNIGTTAVFIQAVRTYSEEIRTSYSSPSGKGADPSSLKSAVLRNWNLAPMEYDETKWDENGVLLTDSLTERNTLHKGSTLYIRPYTLAVKEAYADGGETMTADISAEESARIRILPAFAGGAEVRGASAAVDIAALKDGKGQVISDALVVEAVQKDGTAIVLENSVSYQMSDFVEGAPGAFVYEVADLSDTYDGAVFAVRNAAAGYLQSSGTGAGAAVVVWQNSGAAGSSADADGQNSVTGVGSADADGQNSVTGDDSAAADGQNGTSDFQRWKFEKVSSGIYRIQNVGSGLYLHVDGNAAVQRAKAATETMPKQLWSLRTNEDGSVTFVSNANGRALAADIAGGQATSQADIAGGQATGVPAVIAADGGASTRWNLSVVAPSEADIGVRLTFQGLDSAYGFPELFAELHFNKALISGETQASHRTTISGDAITDNATKENGHVASVSLSFTEIRANVLRETVDAAEVRNGEELTYTITYSNHYDEAHALDLLDFLPGNGDLDFPDIAPVSGGSDSTGTGADGAGLTIREQLATKLADGAEITLVPDSLAASADAGSEIAVFEDHGAIRAEGILKSGETVTIRYRVLVSGAEAGNVIRNSCVQRDAFGVVYSNRVETIVLPEPDFRVQLTLLTGGSGTYRIYAAGAFALLAALGAAAFGRRKKGRCASDKKCVGQKPTHPRV